MQTYTVVTLEAVNFTMNLFPQPDAKISILEKLIIQFQECIGQDPPLSYKRQKTNLNLL